MSDVNITYKGSTIATMDASGKKTLLTEGKYCEDDIEVVYVKSGGDSVLGEIVSLGADGLRYKELPENSFLGSLTKTGDFALAALTGCKVIVMPSISNIGNYTFADNKSIETYDFGASTPNFTRWMFSGSSSMNTLILRKSSVVALPAVDVLNETGFASNGAATGGTLYVPSSLISSYEGASDWSTLLGYAKNSIVPIEGSQYETHYADGTPIT